MRVLRSTTLATAAALVLASGNARGQDYYQQDYYPTSSYNQLFSAQELDNLVAPIALYPDPILAQVFIAATFADQIELAARHVRMFGDNSIDYQPWDVSVKAVAHYPPVLNMLAERTDWTAALGQAYAYQSNDLMDAVQRLRRMARYEGNLISTSHQTIIYERDYIRIVPAHPRVIYVPVYDPYAIYYRRAVFQASIHTPYWSFGVAFPIGSWLSYDCDWLGRRVYYDGWRGHGWRVASRPYINIVNVYVNPRYETVNINRTVINRTVNYVNLNNNYTTVHKNVKFDGYARNVTRVAAAENGARRAGGGAVGTQSGGRASGRGANVQQQSQSGALPQQGTATQSGQQRTASPSGRAQPVQRQQAPVMQQQQAPVTQRQQTPQGSRAGAAAQSSQRTASPNGRAQPVQRQQQAPVIQRQQAPVNERQQQAPVIQRQSAPQNGQGQSSTRSASPNGRGQPAQRAVQTYPSQVTRQPSNVQQQQRQQSTVVQQQRSQAPQVQQQRSLPPTARAQPRSAPAQSSAPQVSRGGGGGSAPAQGQVVQKSKGNSGGSQQSAPGQVRSRSGRGG